MERPLPVRGRTVFRGLMRVCEMALVCWPETKGSLGELARSELERLERFVSCDNEKASLAGKLMSGTRLYAGFCELLGAR